MSGEGVIREYPVNGGYVSAVRWEGDNHPAITALYPSLSEEDLAEVSLGLWAVLDGDAFSFMSEGMFKELVEA